MTITVRKKIKPFSAVFIFFLLQIFLVAVTGCSTTKSVDISEAAESTVSGLTDSIEKSTVSDLSDSIEESTMPGLSESLFEKNNVLHITQGITAITLKKVLNRNVTCTCVKIDLNTPELKIIMAPEESLHASSENPVSLTSQKAFYLEDFARKNNCSVAINTTPFKISKGKYFPLGILKNRGQTLSAPVEKYSALAFYKNEQSFYRCKILEFQADSNLEACSTAAGGFFTIIKDGEKISFAKTKHSRTGCGISDDGRFLYLLTATPDFSLTDNDGLTFEECADIFLALGCTQAMEFDGGHSSGLAINGKIVRKPFIQSKIPAALGFSIN